MNRGQGGLWPGQAGVLLACPELGMRAFATNITVPPQQNADMPDDFSALHEQRSLPDSLRASLVPEEGPLPIVCLVT